MKIPDGVRKFDEKSLMAKLQRFDKTRKRVDGFISEMCQRGAQLPKFS